jgi:hypothetical protein
MPQNTVHVKLKHSAGRFKDDAGNQLEPFITYELEASERIVKAIEIGLLEKQPVPPSKEKRKAPADPDIQEEQAKKN